MSRFVFFLCAALLVGTLYLGSASSLAGIEEEVRRAQNYVRGPVLQFPDAGPIEWKVPSDDLAIEEGLIEIVLQGLDDLPREEEDSGFRVLLGAFTVGEDGTRHDAMIHPPGTEAHGVRSFGWGPDQTWTSVSGAVALAYLPAGASLHVAVEAVGSPPDGVRYSLELAVNPAADPAAPGVVGLARAFHRGLLGVGALLVAALVWLFLRATSAPRP